MKPLHELDALCAEKVAGWKWRKNLGTAAGYQSVSPMSEAGQTLYGSPHECFADAPSYTTDSAAVLGLLEKYDWIAGNHLLDGDYFCDINYPESRIIVRAPTFALAATLALLNAHGVETE